MLSFATISPALGAVAVARPDVWAVQLACFASRDIGCRETSLNRGPCVDKIHVAYDPAWKGEARAYCAEAVWYWIQLTCAALGGKNVFPGYAQTYGNALMTLQRAQAAGTLLVNRTPVIGCAFYRRSSDPKASGHMGIVVSWDGQTLSTIEANQGSSNGIFAYSYQSASIIGSPVFNDPTGSDWGFQFIHIEQIPITATAPTADCAPKVSVPTTPPPTQTPTPGVPMPGGPVYHSQVRGSATGTTNGGGGSVPPTGSPSVVVPDPVCVWDVKAQDKIPHYSRLQRLEVAADIMAPADWLGPMSYKDRNGTAISLPSGKAGQNDNTGFGIFTDAYGNIYFVAPTALDGNRNNTGSIYGLIDNLLGGYPNYYRFTYVTHNGNGWLEGATLMVMGDEARGRYNGQNGAGDKAQPMDIGQDGETFSWFPERKTSFSVGQYPPDGIYDAIRYIEAQVAPKFQGNRLPRPVVFFVGKPEGRDIFDQIDQVLVIAETFVNVVVPGGGTIIGSARALVTQANALFHDSSAFLSLNGWAKMGDALVNIGETLMPDQIRTLQVGFDKVKQDVRAITAPAVSLYAQGSQFADQVLAKLRIVGSSLGMSAKGILSDLQSGNANNVLQQLQQKIGFDDANGMISHFVTSTMVDTGRRWIRARAQSDIISDGSITGIPIMQNLLISGAAGTVIPMMPGINNLGQAMLNDATNDADKGLREIAVRIGMGVAVGESAWDRLVVDALQKRASEIKRIAIDERKEEPVFVMPASIPPEKQICFGKEVCQTIGIKIVLGQGRLACEAPKAPPTARVPVPGMPTANTSVSPSGGGGSVVVVSTGGAGSPRPGSPIIPTTPIAPAPPVSVTPIRGPIPALVPTQPGQPVSQRQPVPAPAPPVSVTPIRGPIPALVPTQPGQPVSQRQPVPALVPSPIPPVETSPVNPYQPTPGMPVNPGSPPVVDQPPYVPPYVPPYTPPDVPPTQAPPVYQPPYTSPAQEVPPTQVPPTQVLPVYEPPVYQPPAYQPPVYQPPIAPPAQEVPPEQQAPPASSPPVRLPPAQPTPALVPSSRKRSDCGCDCGCECDDCESDCGCGSGCGCDDCRRGMNDHVQPQRRAGRGRPWPV